MSSPAESFRAFQRRVVGGTLLAGGVGALVLLPTTGSPAATGLLFGVAASALAIRMHAAEILAQTAASPARARNRARAGSLLRSAIRALAVAPALALPGLSLPWTLVGLLLGQAVLIGSHLRADRLSCPP